MAKGAAVAKLRPALEVKGSNFKASCYQLWLIRTYIFTWIITGRFIENLRFYFVYCRQTRILEAVIEKS